MVMFEDPGKSWVLSTAVNSGTAKTVNLLAVRLKVLPVWSSYM